MCSKYIKTSFERGFKYFKGGAVSESGAPVHAHSPGDGRVDDLSCFPVIFIDFEF